MVAVAPDRLMTSLDNLDPDVIRVAQAAADVKRERDSLRLEVQQLQSTLAIANTRLEERDEQIRRIEAQLLIAAMRNGQQVSIIEQINKLTYSYHESVHADVDAQASRNNCP